MLVKPDIQDETILACLREEFGLRAVQFTFLPLGADLNTAVYSAATGDGARYFVKLRSGEFDETSVGLPAFLQEQGVGHIIAPQKNKAGVLWSELGAFKLILYPFIEGADGYEVSLSDEHWVELGATLRRIQALQLPPDLAGKIRPENYDPQWRGQLRAFMAGLDDFTPADPLAREMTAFIKEKRSEVEDLLRRVDYHLEQLRSHVPKPVLCHTDLHAGNLLIEPGGSFYIVDWDAPLLAPKERDLMYAGGGQFPHARTPEEEERLFYQGYGPVTVDPNGLAYYRYERIIEDIAIFCEQIGSSQGGREDLEQSLVYLKSNFQPGGVLEIAKNADNGFDHGREAHGFGYRE
jgi:spectinomycin phosphotransferase